MSMFLIYLPQDDDEGIDVRTEGCTSSTSCASGTSGGDQNRKNRGQGQYNYELFSIMIHSGSASGGHYYAYIKDFPTREWYDGVMLGFGSHLLQQFYSFVVGIASTIKQCQVLLMMISGKLTVVDRHAVLDTLRVPIHLVPTLTC